jgi:hypothetical protein
MSSVMKSKDDEISLLKRKIADLKGNDKRKTKRKDKKLAKMKETHEMVIGRLKEESNVNNMAQKMIEKQCHKIKELSRRKRYYQQMNSHEKRKLSRKNEKVEKMLSSSKDFGKIPSEVLTHLDEQMHVKEFLQKKIQLKVNSMIRGTLDG